LNILAGTGELRLEDGSKHQVGPGSVFVLPTPMRHDLANTGKETLRDRILRRHHVHPAVRWWIRAIRRSRKTSNEGPLIFVPSSAKTVNRNGRSQH
jgi:Cupin domain